MLVAVLICAVASIAGCGGALPFEPIPAQPPPIVSAPAGPAVPPPMVQPVVPPDPPAIDAPVADPLRGAALFMSIPRADLLGCADCHSDNPVLRNFGNIFSGRNAVDLIRRAITTNTGGMAYLGGFFSATDLADIAAYLGNSPGSLQFPATAVGGTSDHLAVTISSSTKVGISNLSMSIQGDFVIVGSTCGEALERFSSCRIDVAYRPSVGGAGSGTLLISHSGTPAPVRILLSAGPVRTAQSLTLPPLASEGYRVLGKAQRLAGVGHG